MKPPKVGIYGLIRALQNEDVQKCMELIVQVLKALGKATTEICNAKKEIDQ